MSHHDKNIVIVTDAEERIVHWVLAGTCLFCLITGLGFMFPSWTFIANFLGGYYAMKWMHIFSGLGFTVALIYSFFLWKKDCIFEESDLQWVLKAGGYLWPVKDLPPVYKYNAGQKAFFWVLMLSGIIIVVSGFIMWNPVIFPQLLAQFAYMCHAMGVMVLGAFIVIHMYLGTAGNPGTVSAMITGEVTRAWCETHCPRWLADHDGKKPEEAA